MRTKLRVPTYRGMAVATFVALVTGLTLLWYDHTMVSEARIVGILGFLIVCSWNLPDKVGS